MKRVLVIPSWYASAELPFAGTFFREQALLVRSHYDIRLLLVKRHVRGRRTPHLWLRPRLVGPMLSAFDVQKDSDGLMIHRAEFEIADRRHLDDDSQNATEARHVIEALQSHGWLPDTIHCHCAVPPGSIGEPIARKLGVQLVVTEHQHLIRQYFSPDEWQAACAVYGRAAKVAAVSEFERQMMLMNGAPCDPVVIGNLVDENAFPLAPHPGVEGSIRLLFVGLASPLKDYETFFRALSRLNELTSAPLAVRIVCADRPAARAKIAEQALQHAGRSAIEIISSADRRRMSELIHWSTMLVSTSIAETFGVAVCEALMCGRPVVTTASGGVSDFVVDGWNGYIVRIGDAESVARRICDAVDGRLGASPEQVRAAIIARYGRAAFSAKLAALYEIT